AHEPRQAEPGCETWDDRTCAGITGGKIAPSQTRHGAPGAAPVPGLAECRAWRRVTRLFPDSVTLSRL
ncbi:MAG: hypothetical protein ACRESC_04805, partial [Gammaproteobacteria bacterium]